VLNHLFHSCAHFRSAFGKPPFGMSAHGWHTNCLHAPTHPCQLFRTERSQLLCQMTYFTCALTPGVPLFGVSAHSCSCRLSVCAQVLFANRHSNISRALSTACHFAILFVSTYRVLAYLLSVLCAHFYKSFLPSRAYHLIDHFAQFVDERTNLTR
jgi:hypothetical protein